MLSNWQEGHSWLLQQFGPAARPRVGWSLDPFGLSATQATLQSMLGMDAWFFTRVPKTTLANMKADQTLEFIWRGSASLPANSSEIFCHVFESYYCMPVPTYAFEWGASRGAIIPDAGNVVQLSQHLAEIAKNRSAYFRSNNVLIPWGCDYQYQNSALIYEKTDWLISTINAHPQWGVEAQYCTPSEYLAELRRSGVQLPVKPPGQSFFPSHDIWPNGSTADGNSHGWVESGYFTSRPTLKGLSQAAHGPLIAAESLFARHATTLDAASRAKLWSRLESARRGLAIVQHHDAITGTPCSGREGCTGVDQVAGGRPGGWWSRCS